MVLHIFGFHPNAWKNDPIRQAFEFQLGGANELKRYTNWWINPMRARFPTVILLRMDGNHCHEILYRSKGQIVTFSGSILYFNFLITGEMSD